MSNDLRHGFRIFTQDLCSPFVLSEPVWNGSIPFDLPHLNINIAGNGWYYCPDLSTALRIAGLWRSGRPSRAFEVEALEQVVVEVNQPRAA